MKSRLLLLSILMISTIVIHAKISKTNQKQNVVAVEESNDINTTEVQPNEVALQNVQKANANNKTENNNDLVQQTEPQKEQAESNIQTSNQPTAQSSFQSDNHQNNISEIEAIHFSENMDAIIDQQDRDDSEITQKQLEDLVYKYSSNEERDQLQNKLNQIDASLLN